jgi:hypothetical protein
MIVCLFLYWVWRTFFGLLAKDDAKDVASKKETLSQMRDRKEDLTEEKKVTLELIETKEDGK